jgi:hypothetical protein
MWLLHRRAEIGSAAEEDGKGAAAAGVGDQVNIVAISGSLQRESSNSALLRGVGTAAASVDFTLWDELGELPYFGPDRQGDEHVASLRRAIADADAVLISTPEYAGGMPGALKNALDWLVGSGELYGKPVVIMSAAPSAERGTKRSSLGRGSRWYAGRRGEGLLHSGDPLFRRRDGDRAQR